MSISLDRTCLYCDKVFTLEDMVYDHFIPRSLGGKNTQDNKNLVCFWCNCSKGAKLFRSVEEVKRYIKGGNGLFWREWKDGYMRGFTNKEYFEEYSPWKYEGLHLVENKEVA